MGDASSPAVDDAMTEVVRCKAEGERGVAAAASLCAERHLDRVVAASPAPLVLVLGAKARLRVTALWHLPAGSGLDEGRGPHGGDDLVVQRLGGRERVVAYLTHPTSMTKTQTFAATYPGRLEDLRELVAGAVTVESVAVRG